MCVLEIDRYVAEEQKQHKKEASRRFAQKNPQKRKKDAALANFKAKARRHLEKDGKEITIEIVNEMAGRWMAEKFGNEIGNESTKEMV